MLGVDDQVQQHLLHLVGIGEDGGQPAGEGVEGRDVRHPLLVGARGQGVVHDLVHVDERSRGVALAGERQQVAHDLGRPLRLAENGLDAAFRLGFDGARGQAFGARQDGRQRVVELVGHARDGLAQGRHLLRLHQLVTRVPPLRLELPPLADVSHEGVEARWTGVCRRAQGGGDLDPHRAAVGPPETDEVVADGAVAAQPRDEVGAGPVVEEPFGRERPHPLVGLVRVEPEHELQVRIGPQRLDAGGFEGADVDALGDGLVQPREQLRRRAWGTARTHSGGFEGADVDALGDGLVQPREQLRRRAWGTARTHSGWSRQAPRVRVTRTADVPGEPGLLQLPRGAGGVGVA